MERRQGIFHIICQSYWYLFDEMNIDYKDDTIENKDRIDLTEKLNGSEDEEVVDAPKEEFHLDTISLDDDLAFDACNLMEHMMSPLAMLKMKYPSGIPDLSFSFFRYFIDYFRMNGPESIELLELILQSSEHNISSLINFGIINETIISQLPESFGAILYLMKFNNGKNNSINHFINSNGVYYLIKLSFNTKYHLPILKILKRIGHCFKGYSDIYLPTEASFDLISGTSSEEFEELTFGMLIDNIFYTDDVYEIKKLLKVLSIMFQHSSEAVSCIGTKFLDRLEVLFLEPELKIHVLNILQNGFDNGLHSIMYQFFDRPYVTIESSIINETLEDSEAPEEAIIDVISIIGNIIKTQYDSNRSLMDYISQDLLNRIAYYGNEGSYKIKKEVVNTFCLIEKCLHRSEIKILINTGVIGIVSDFISTNPEDNLEDAIIMLGRLIISSRGTEDIAEEDGDRLLEIMDMLEDLVNSPNKKNAVVACQIVSTVKKWLKENDGSED